MLDVGGGWRSVRRRLALGYPVGAMKLRRAAWIAALIAGMPGLLVCLVTGYAFFLLPVVVIAGAVVGRSESGALFALGMFLAAAGVFAFALGFYRENDENWWVFSIYGSSAFLTVLVAFKAGMELRQRMFAGAIAGQKDAR
jgi:uncharacterized membrane protein HdeD (DUF308 family)